MKIFGSSAGLNHGLRITPTPAQPAPASTTSQTSASLAATQRPLRTGEPVRKGEPVQKGEPTHSGGQIAVQARPPVLVSNPIASPLPSVPVLAPVSSAPAPSKPVLIAGPIATRLPDLLSQPALPFQPIDLSA